MENKTSKQKFDELDRAAMVMIYGIFAAICLLLVACVGGSAWVLWIITKVVTQ